jgi:hypothetical protein
MAVRYADCTRRHLTGFHCNRNGNGRYAERQGQRSRPALVTSNIYQLRRKTSLLQGVHVFLVKL